MIQRKTFTFQQDDAADDGSQTLALDEIEQEDLITDLENTSRAQSQKSRFVVDILILISMSIYIFLTLNSLRHLSFLFLGYITLLLSHLPFLSPNLLTNLSLPQPLHHLHSLPQPHLLPLILLLSIPPLSAFYVNVDSAILAILILPPMLGAMALVRVEEEKKMEERLGELKRLRYGLKGA